MGLADRVYQLWRATAYPNVERKIAEDSIAQSQFSQRVWQRIQNRIDNEMRAGGAAMPAPAQSRTPQEILVNEIFPVTDRHKIPRKIVASMFAAEGRGKGLGAKRNNFFNLGAVDNNPGQATSYPTPAAGAEAFAKFLTSPRWANGRANEAPMYFNDPLTALKQIEEQGYAGDKRTYRQRANNGFDRYWKFVSSTPEWKQY